MDILKVLTYVCRRLLFTLSKGNTMLLNIFPLLLAIFAFGLVGYRCHNKYEETGEDGYGFLSVIGLAVSIIAVIWLCAIILTNGYDFMKRNVTFQEYMNEKSLTQRLLLEDYNPSNLEKALVFNNKQKLIKVENFNWLTAYNTSFVYIDTIAIPATNFMPSQRIIVKGE